MRKTIATCAGLVALLMVGGCSPTTGSDRDVWGDEALDYFQTWAQAYSTNDTYGVLDFYMPNATVEDRTGIFRNATPSVPTLLQGNTARLTREVLDVFVGIDQTIALVVWPDYTTEYGLVRADVENGFIASETILLDADSLQRSLRADPEIVTRYDAVFESLATAWTDEPERLTSLYAGDAVIRDALTGREITGYAAIAQLATGPPGSWATTAITSDDAEAGKALFLDPVEYGADPQRAIGVFEITDENNCTFRTAVSWRFAGNAIVEEHRFPEVESFRACTSTDLVEGWWTGLDSPGPRDQVETGTVATVAGNSISVRNGTPRLEELVTWGLNQYAAAGLPEPRVDTVTFEPTRRCKGVAGRVITAGTARDLVLCIYETELGRQSGEDAPFALGARVGMLHELAHAWMLDEVDTDTQQAVLAVSGRQQWIDGEAPWKDRGVEYAAQIIAWGLANEPVALVELDRPPCGERTTVYELLTGTSPGDASACR
ncbi:MAG: hypothetical protein OEP52_07130 [Acidimicrobiia bacterium]|nr:hypothetical protein [Acidimicrobiia bacterium]